MAVYRVYRDSGKADVIEADSLCIKDGCLLLRHYEQHAAGADCDCEPYQRVSDDGDPRAHRASVDVAAYVAEYWRRVERVSD